MENAKRDAYRAYEKNKTDKDNLPSASVYEIL